MANRQTNAYAEETARRRYANYDIELNGNAVRQVAIPEEVPEERPKRKQVTREEIERAQREANERAFGFGSFVIVAISLAFVCFALFTYLGERGALHAHTKEVKSLSQELNEKTVLNDNRLINIEASIDFTEIYNRAIKELNMSFPGKNQVLYFSTTESEYISQYEEIPQNK